MGEGPGLIAVLGSIRKQAEQAMGSKPVSSTPLRPLRQLLLQVPALLDFLSRLLLMVNCDVEL